MVPDDSKKSEMPDLTGLTGCGSTTARAADGKPVEAEVHEIYEVVASDRLSKTAKRKYGDPKLCTVIHEANKDVMRDPNVIQIG